LNSLAEGMVDEVAKRKHQARVEEAMLAGHILENNDATSIIDSPRKEKFQRNIENHHNRLYDNLSSPSTLRSHQASSPILLPNNYHQRQAAKTNPLSECSSSPSSMKQRRPTGTRPSQLTCSTNVTNDKTEMIDKVNMVFVDEDSPDVDEQKQFDEIKRNFNIKTNVPITNGTEHSNRSCPKLETFL
jgi:hypothetical protein